MSDNSEARQQVPSVSRSVQTGMFMAAGTAPRAFERTLMPRSSLDQGIITGLSMAMNYGAGTLMQDIIENTVAFLARRDGTREEDDQALRRLTMLGDLLAFGGGIAMQKALAQQPNESLGRAGLRTSAYMFAMAGFSGFSVGFLQDFLHEIDRSSRRDRKLRRLPVALIGGGLIAVLAEYNRRRRLRTALAEETHRTLLPSEEVDINVGRSLLLGLGVTGALIALAGVERGISTVSGRALASGLPGNTRLWKTMGHVAGLGALAGIALLGLDRVTQDIEAGTGKIEPAFDTPPTSPLVSGGPGSLIPWRTMGREGRRHVVTQLRSEWIERVMQEAGAKEPIRVFVGLDSARSEEERVALGIAELERTGAFDRELLIAVSPTGTGYVNYVAIECAEYFTRGNCATVTLQYSKRPSPLSLDRVWEGRKQFRMLIAAIRRRLYTRPPDKRPKFVVFGESLGAHTSQDAFLHTGTQGLEDAGVERALWIGTPHLSKWRAQTLDSDRPDVDRALLADVDNFGEIEAMSDDARRKLRYVLVTHHNDGVGLFGADLLIQRPAWLDDPDTRPPSVPKWMKWFPPTTAVQTAIDMKNAMNVVPGEFVARGHDYRADLARFVREVYDLRCSDDQLERVEEALRRYEGLREEWMRAHDPKQLASDDGVPKPEVAEGEQFGAHAPV